MCVGEGQNKRGDASGVQVARWGGEVEWGQRKHGDASGV